MNNEPVAWGWYDLEIKRFFPHWDEDLMENKEGCIPLYTHPVKEHKEPSVKEIDDLWINVINNIPANDHRPREWHFAKAILRKAQEK